MAQADRELAEILTNMEAMRWTLRVGHAPDTVVVYPPEGRPHFTVSLRTNRGDGKRDALTAIKRSGYHEAWERHQAMRTRIGEISDREDAELIEAITPLVEAVVTELNNLIPAQPTTPEDNPVTETPTPATVNIPARKVTDAEHFEGVAIVSRGPAKMIVPRSGDEPVEVRGVEEVLLENGQIMYRCTRSARCFYTRDTANAVTAHLAAHGNARQAARDDAEYARRSAGVKAGNEARRARLAELADMGAPAALVELAEILTFSAQAAKDLAKIAGEPAVSDADLAAMQALMDEQEAEIKRLSLRPDITPEAYAVIVDKARRWDAFRELTTDPNLS